MSNNLTQQLPAVNQTNHRQRFKLHRGLSALSTVASVMFLIGEHASVNGTVQTTSGWLWIASVLSAIGTGGMAANHYSQM